MRSELEKAIEVLEMGKWYDELNGITIEEDRELCEAIRCLSPAYKALQARIAQLEQKEKTIKKMLLAMPIANNAVESVRFNVLKVLEDGE